MRGRKNWRRKGEGRKQLGTVYLCCISFWFYLTTCLRTLTRASVAGNFGLEGQETIRNHGARELDRLFLADWEVNQFWSELHLGAEFENNISLRYFHYYAVLYGLLSCCS